MKNIVTGIILSLLLALPRPAPADVQTGLEILRDQGFAPFKGKRVGLIVNQTAADRKGKHLVDILREAKVDVGAIFAPEHGFKGAAEPGAKVADDQYEGIPVYSLYGKIRKPTPDMLKGLDLLVFDIGNVGVKFYTNISTLFYAMEAAAEEKLPF